MGPAVSAETSSPPVVTDVRFWSLGDVTRIAIETTEGAEYRYEQLRNPDRLFFDLLGARLRLSNSAERIHVIPVGDKLLRQIRVAENRPGTTRIVFDLASPVEFQAGILANPDRLIIELRAREGAVQQTPAAPVPIKPVLAPSTLVSSAAKPAAKPTKEQPVKTVSAQPPVAASAKEQPAATAAKEKPVEVSAKKQPVRTAAAEPPVPVPAPVPTRTPPSAATVKDQRVATPVKKPPETVAAAEEPPIGTPATRNGEGGQSLIRALGLKLGRVVLDPGHGGKDTGTISPSGMTEKDLALDVAKRLGALIEEKLGADVFYTRTDDTFVPLEERTRLANEYKADLFLSIHANASKYSSIAGAETYYLNFTTSRAALDVAARENASSQTSIHQLEDLLQKIALKDKIDESREFAEKVQSALHGTLASSRTTKNRGVKKAPFVVLIGASMPSVLAEIAFLSNAKEESLLKGEEGRQRAAEALYKGVFDYAQTLSHFQVAKREAP